MGPARVDGVGMVGGWTAPVLQDSVRLAALLTKADKQVSETWQDPGIPRAHVIGAHPHAA